MEAFDAIRTLLAVRAYADRPVPAAVVHQILEAGRMTGSAMNRQPWHFLLVDDRERLREVAAIAKTGPYITQAPLAVVVLIERTGSAVSDASRAIQSMVLTAWSAGVASNWVGFNGMDELRPLLGIPETYDILAVLPFGYPADSELGQGVKKRKPFDDVVSYGRFGEKLPPSEA